MDLVKVNSFSLRTKFERYFSEINTEAYALACSNILGSPIALTVLKEKYNQEIYLSKVQQVEINEKVKLGDFNRFLSEAKKIKQIREKLYSSIFLNKSYDFIKKDLINFVSYKYFFGQYANKVLGYNAVSHIMDEIVWPHKYFISDEKYSLILRKYGYLFEKGDKQKEVEEYFSKSQTEFSKQDLDTAIKLGFTVSEEEDYLIALVFHLKQAKK